MVHEAEIILGTQHVQVLTDEVVGEIAAREANHLVENRQGVSHSAVGLLRYQAQGLRLCRVALFGGYALQMLDCVLCGDALEVVNLTAAQYGGQDFVLLGGGQDEDDVRWRLFERL